jgi:PST family polysaccharide transporter
VSGPAVLPDGTTGGPEHVTPSGPPATGATAAPDVRALDRSLASGVAWTAGVKWLSQLLSWASTFIVARHLAPGDYGLVTMATIYTGLVALVNEFGMGSAIIKHRELSRGQIAQISGLCVLFGAAGMLVTAAAAWPMSRFYGEPALTGVMLALSLNFLVTSFRTVPLSLMQRDLQFRVAALNEGIQAIVLSVAMVIFAVLGFGYWTLVIGTLLSGLLSTLLAYAQRPHAVAWPRRGEIGEALTFGWHIVGSRIGWYVYSNADFFIASKLLGKGATGAYSFAMSIASIPVEKVSALVGRVTPSILSAVQDDHAAVRRYVLSLTDGLALVTVPAAFGIALVAPDLVLLLGPQWRPAAVPLQVLGVYASFRSIVTILPYVAQMVGLSRFGMRNAFLSAVVMPVAFLAGSRWGIGGIAAAWVVAYPLVTIPLYVAVFRRIEMPAGAYLRALWPALSSALLMAAGVWAVRRWAIAPDAALVPRLLVQVGTGALLYPLALLAFHRARVVELKNLVRSLREKR